MQIFRLCVSLSILLPCGSVLAQVEPVRPPAVVTRGDIGKLGLIAGLTALAYQADGSARNAARTASTQRNDLARTLSAVGNPYGGFAVLGLGAGMWGGGLIFRNETVATVGLRAVEAITVSGIITKVIKGVAGRARPRVAPHQRDDFRFGRGFGSADGAYESLPSGHATAAFAFAAAVSGEVARRAPEHARAVAITTYGLGVVTAYARMHVDAHWLSDVTLGAGIGMVSGWAVTRWHATRPVNSIDRWLLRPVVGPAGDGSMRLGAELAVR